MIHVTTQKRLAGLLLGFGILTLAGGCATMDVRDASFDDAHMAAQHSWLFPGPRGVAPCPMASQMECASAPSALTVNGGP